MELNALDNVTTKKLLTTTDYYEKQMGSKEFFKYYSNLMVFQEDKAGLYYDSRYKNLKPIQRSDTQKEVFRLLKRAFSKEEFQAFEIEKQVSIFNVDVVLNLKHENLHNIALEVQSPVTKWFRTDYPTPQERVREKVIRAHGYTPIQLDTQSLPGYPEASDAQKTIILKDWVLKEAK